MKKLLIATAALAVVAGSAQAQSSVTVYGLIDAGYATSSGKYGAGLEVNQKAVGGLHSANGTGSLSGSRLGFRGTEDLGGGLKANFVLEQAIIYSNGASALSDPSSTDVTASNAVGFTGANLRQGWAGLSGGFGDVRIGTHNSLAKDATESIDPLSGVTITGYFHQLGLPTTRPTNSVTYLSPRTSGFQLQAQYDEGESNTSTTIGKDNYSAALAVNYVAGPLTAMISRENRRNVGIAALALLIDLPSTGSDVLGIGADATNAQSVDRVTHTAYGATYTIAGIKLAALATDLKFVDTVAANNGKIKSTLFGATIPVGSNALVYASMSKADITDAGVKTHDVTGYQLVGQYNLTKRSHVYAALGQAKYDSPTANADVKVDQMAIGMRHSF